LNEAADQPRGLSGPLLLGILALPVIFSWFTLRRGYSNTLRIGAFLYTAFALAAGIVHATNL
jgi:hypothetical protein